MRNCKAEATNVVQVRMWSREYYKNKPNIKLSETIWHGLIIDEKSKTKKSHHFHSVSKMLSILEQLYEENEAKKRVN
jgi:hypothetical protein